jgi:hypothetical protein
MDGCPSQFQILKIIKLRAAIEYDIVDDIINIEHDIVYDIGIYTNN